MLSVVRRAFFLRSRWQRNAGHLGNLPLCDAEICGEAAFNEVIEYREETTPTPKRFEDTPLIFPRPIRHAGGWVTIAGRRQGVAYLQPTIPLLLACQDVSVDVRVLKPQLR